MIEIAETEEGNFRKSGQHDRIYLTEVPKNSEEIITAKKKIDDLWSLLNEQVSKLDTHIDNVLQKHENDFLNAFKCQMFTLYTQLKELKKKTDENEMKLKRDEQLNKLQSSLDWFREEAVHLGESTKLYKKEADKWKAKAESLDDDRKFLEEQLKFAKSRIKELQEEKSQKSFSERSKESSVSRLSSTTFVPSSKNGLIILELLQKYPKKDGQLYYELEKHLNSSERVYQDTLKKLQNNYNNEKKKFFNVSAQQTSSFFEKSEMENLFLDCIEEVRKEVIKRRSKVLIGQKYTKRASSSHKPVNTVLSSTDKIKILELLVSNEKVLVMIYEKLFPHRVNHYPLISKNEEVAAETNQSLEELLKQVPSRSPPKSAAPSNRGRIFL